MAEAWETWRDKGAPGIIWLDPDIVPDLHDLAALQVAQASEPGAVWCSLHKLWPASTRRPTWVWAHGPWEGDRPGMSTSADGEPGWFAMGMTYTPAALLEDAKHELPLWRFGQIDMSLSATARELGIPIRVARLCQPKHLHYRPRKEDSSWRQ